MIALEVMDFIDTLRPSADDVAAKVHERYPSLTDRELDLVIKMLREEAEDLVAEAEQLELWAKSRT